MQVVLILQNYGRHKAMDLLDPHIPNKTHDGNRTDKLLSEIQRLCCLNITEAMRTTSYAGLEASLNLPIIHFQVTPRKYVEGISLTLGKSTSCAVMHPLGSALVYIKLLG